MTRDVAILALDQMEVLDFAGSSAVFTTCNRVAERRGEATPFSVTSVADTPRVRARAGMTIVVDHQLRDVPHVDVVVVPCTWSSDWPRPNWPKRPPIRWIMTGDDECGDTRCGV